VPATFVYTNLGNKISKNLSILDRSYLVPLFVITKNYSQLVTSQ